MFLHRENELEILEKDFSIPNSSFNFIFGRRKIGKTSFINSYISGKNSFYISFLEMMNSITFQTIHKNIENFLNKKIDTFDTFESFLKIIAKETFEEKLILVLDDFQNLIKVEKDALSLFYKDWNKELSSSNIQVIILSSICSSNKDDEYIYKKSSNIIKLNKLPYFSIKEFIPEVQAGDIMHIFSSYGTNPEYLKLYDPKKDFLLNLKENFLSYEGIFFNEGMDFLKKDLNEISTYSSILYAIALGNNKIGAIAGFLNLKSTYLTRYLQKLIDIMIIKKYVPINEDIKKSKFGRYEIEDNFIKFWFCYIYPNYSNLQKGDTYSVISHIRNDFTKRLVRNTYKMHILNLIKNDPYKYLGFIPNNIGSWWNNKDTNIDIIAYDSKNIIFIDTKWRDKQKLEQSYAILRNKSNEFKTTLNKKYIIFSKTSSTK
ncbi:ATPase [Arcobacter nitrofigilis DSM 7299]|uniref:ATPase n=1 Tax=Arcobacter nitrofigilis (strain ATCC 33309 / DSM 7299 / CCUG 15893 / LMG 7604 / NCTC 12251 / CI) TaxID=572480 RepID=D5V5X3_ARCNC|nr:ATP-binding protein [Arcobacter nitrofigilis]ADG93140.1 ATPase [Arcobacter nitrofigilis DSM 7299]